jgi:hypothetical protein
LAGILFAGWSMLTVPAAAQVINGFDLHGALVPPDQIQSGGPARDGIPAINAPKFVSAAAARLEPQDRVLGIVRGGTAKAYPIKILNWHEIVNDRFGEEPIAITYCPLCGTGIAYLATVGDRATTFGVSGLLYNSDVLLYDRATQSLWSQLLSQAVAGPLKGQRLTPVALTHTTWADWKARHPESQVLSPDTGFARDYARDPYAGYASNPKIMFPVASRSDRFPAKELVLGIEMNGRHKAYAFSELEKMLGGEATGTIDDVFAGRKLRVQFNRAHRTATAFDDQGKELPATIAYWFAWVAFFPQTEIYAGRYGQARTK